MPERSDSLAYESLLDDVAERGNGHGDGWRAIYRITWGDKFNSKLEHFLTRLEKVGCEWRYPTDGGRGDRWGCPICDWEYTLQVQPGDDVGVIATCFECGADYPKIRAEVNRLHRRTDVPPANRTTDRIENDLDDQSSWEPVDLSDVLAGKKVRPQADLFARDDGRCIFYRGQFNGIHGTDTVGKSFVALFVAVRDLLAGRHVVWLDYEDPDETTIVGRLLDLGVSAEVVHGHFHYFNPKTAPTDADMSKLCRYAVQWNRPVSVLDSLGEAFSLEGINENLDAEVAPWLRRVIRRLVSTGATVIAIDHTINDAESEKKLRPSGSKRKRAAITGHLVLVEALIPLTKDEGGEVKLTCAKDRHGNYRRGECVAKIVVGCMRAIDMPDMTFTVQAPPDETQPVVGSAVALNALRGIHLPGGVSATVWRSNLPDVSDRTFYRYRSELVRTGEVENVGSDAAPRYRVAVLPGSTATALPPIEVGR